MRKSGILLPVSSLPSPYGIGTIGRDARDFVDFLEAAGQTLWQILPIGPTGYGDSPYQSFSTFAANPYLIDLDELVAEGLLYPEEINTCSWGGPPSRIDYGLLFENRYIILRLAANRMDVQTEEFRLFEAEESGWLDDYALFMAIKTSLDMVPLCDWPPELRRREKAALNNARHALADEILFWKQLQFLFFRQWLALREYAAERGVQIVGDVPIYVSPDSSDLWAHPALFQVDDDLNLIEVAGCPPDYFSPLGQLWGNPLYDWPKHLETGYSWWIQRMRHAARVYDIIRIDHFRGFESYYAIPAEDQTAEHGIWRPGPGTPLIDALKRDLPGLDIIAEDLGVITPEVRQMLVLSAFPGMRVLQFAFDSREGNEYLPHNYPFNTVVYTGTHDNTTTEDWQLGSPPATVQFAREYLDVDDPDLFTWRFIRAGLASTADTCIVPMQDYLRLGAESRLNTPGTSEGNWRWRVEKSALSLDLAEKIFHMTELYGRVKLKLN